MASQRDIRRRITSVQNTRKITKAMEMVAAARLRRAQQRIEATRPYALNMLEFIGQLVRYLPVDVEPSIPLLKPHAEVKKVAIIALTADRGLCGAFNSNIMRRASTWSTRTRPRASRATWSSLGRKGVSTVALPGLQGGQGLPGRHRAHRLPRRPGHHRTGSSGATRPRTIDRVHLVFNRFKSAMEQYVDRPGDPAHPGGAHRVSTRRPRRRRAHGLHLRAVGGGRSWPTCCPPTSRSPSTGRSWRAWPASTARA